MISATGTLRCCAKAAEAIAANSTQRPKKSRMFIRYAFVTVGNNRPTLVHPGFFGNEKPHTSLPALPARVAIGLHRQRAATWSHFLRRTGARFAVSFERMTSTLIDQSRPRLPGAHGGIERRL